MVGICDLILVVLDAVQPLIILPKTECFKNIFYKFWGNVYSVGFFESKKLFEGVPYFGKNISFAHHSIIFFSVISINIKRSNLILFKII